ncbi:MAG: hypothetical protein RL108_32 [Bacteroidota bacterium]|jgi:hypothetical protein
MITYNLISNNKNLVGGTAMIQKKIKQKFFYQKSHS